MARSINDSLALHTEGDLRPCGGDEPVLIRQMEGKTRRLGKEIRMMTVHCVED